MTIDLIQSYAEFLTLKEDWNSLLTDSASHVPFLRHEYLANWWQTLGGGEWENGNLAVLLHRDENNTLDGIAPFFLNQEKILFLGSFEISDYLDFIAPPNVLPALISETIKMLSSDEFPEWKTLDLYNIPENSPSIPLLRQAVQEAGFKAQVEIIQPAPAISLPTTWQEYLDSLDDRYRHEIERKNRKAEGYFLPVDWYIVDNDQNIENELDDFLGLMANSPEKESFLTDQMINQIKMSALAAHQEGWLQLAFMVVGDIKAAGYLNFDFDGKIWVYNSGINPLFENISPGWVLLSKLINWSIQEGRTGFDFMRGDEEYKFQFGGISKNILRMQISK